MKVEMIELYDHIIDHGIGRSDILEVKKEHIEQYKSFYKSYSTLNLENMIQDRSLLKLTQLKLKNQISKLTERIKLYSNKLSVSRNSRESKDNLSKEINILERKNLNILGNKQYRAEFKSNKENINLLYNLYEHLILDKDTNAFWRSKVKELAKERQLLKNYLKVLNKFHSNLKKSIYDLEKDIYMKQEENKPND